MDYCTACRRHLNGALACAGCGTPAEYLIPAAPPRPAAASPGSDPAALADVYADSLVVLSGAGQQGRAGSRRRATHRRRRRTALTAGIGLLLAGGATLGLARMATDGQRTDRAATVVLTDDAGPEQPAPLPGLTGTPAAPSAVPSGKAAGAGSAKATAGATKTAGPGATAGGSQGPAPSASASGKAGSGTPGPGGTVDPTASGPVPGTTGTAQPPGTPPRPPQPQPTPKPRKTCVFWIFSCN
ncbi:SCO2400 family protein [Streptomyces sp. 4.24]|uniref:SCO2400 family protein n=1 Tax=Streptomyces tritrimontium TaxID=3406573 RepID=UPI003BB658BD